MRVVQNASEQPCMWVCRKCLPMHIFPSASQRGSSEARRGREGGGEELARVQLIQKACMDAAPSSLRTLGIGGPVSLVSWLSPDRLEAGK